ncbi:MAG TPA: hypothetical protein VGG10_16830 [Rhizomicrobium sp.]|jgi:hypothetical protein
MTHRHGPFSALPADELAALRNVKHGITISNEMRVRLTDKGLITQVLGGWKLTGDGEMHLVANH